MTSVTLPFDRGTVARLLNDAAARLVLPRFRHLQPADIEAKVTPGGRPDLVTIVDREVEADLTGRLQALLPAPVIGEEATYRDPGLLEALQANGWVWLLDPIDGTKRFAAGDDRFGIMVALLYDGVTEAAWVLLPARETLFVAERGRGAWAQGQPLTITSPSADAAGTAPQGMLISRFMPDVMRATALRRAGTRFRLVPVSGCAAVDYPAVVHGDLDFIVYYRLLPWDHAAPALILTEAGGIVAHAAGGRYSPRSAFQPTIVARERAVVEAVAACFTEA